MVERRNHDLSQERKVICSCLSRRVRDLIDDASGSLRQAVKEKSAIAFPDPNIPKPPNRISTNTAQSNATKTKTILQYKRMLFFVFFKSLMWRMQ
jgi:hypothetical protein